MWSKFTWKFFPRDVCKHDIFPRVTRFFFRFTCVNDFFDSGRVHDTFLLQVCLKDIFIQNHPSLPQKSNYLPLITECYLLRGTNVLSLSLGSSMEYAKTPSVVLKWKIPRDLKNFWITLILASTGLDYFK